MKILMVIKFHEEKILYEKMWNKILKLSLLFNILSFSISSYELIYHIFYL